MILVTVGGQMPFNRLVKTVDQWAANHPDTQCFAQIGRGGSPPQHMEWAEFLPPSVLREKLERANLIVAHAGMGTILTALDLGKSLIIMPRRAYLHETRNDHQVATAERLEAMGLVVNAVDEKLLLKRLADPTAIHPHHSSSPFASPQLLETVRSFIVEPPDAVVDIQNIDSNA